jgi:hypothetical protein
MFNKTKLPVLFFFFFAACHTRSVAQINLSKWQVGVNGGVFIYQGDLTPNAIGSYKSPGPVFGLNISRVLSPSFAIRGNFVFGHLNGDDALYNSPLYRKERNFRFTALLGEVSALLVWNIFGNNSNELGLRFSPYLFTGAGIGFINISRDFSRMNKQFFVEDSKQTLGLAADILHQTPRVIPVLPIGVGLEYYLSQKISLTLETNFRYTFTDYLDGFSYAANPAKKDFYHSHTVGVVYRWSGKDKLGCPAMKY